MSGASHLPKDPIASFLIGKAALPDHPATVLNPNGRAGFVITEVKRDGEGRYCVRGDDTMWFGESVIIKFQERPNG